MCGCACHLSAALRLSDSRLWDGSGRQWRQQATRLQPTGDYCGDGAQRVRTRCKQHTEPQTTFGGWNTSVRSGWPGTDTEWLMSDQCRGQVPHEPGEDAWNQIYRLAFALLSLSRMVRRGVLHTLSDNPPHGLPNRSNSCHKLEVLWSTCSFLEDQLYLGMCSK